MNKRFWALTLTGALCASLLTGCGGGTSASTEGSDTASTGESRNIAVIVKLTDGHFNKVIAGAKAYAAEHEGITVDIQSPTSATSYDEQVNMIETSLGNPGVDAVVLAPLQSDSAAALVSSADKPIIAVDTDFTSDKKSSFVGTGNEAAAKDGGKSAVEEAKKRGADKPTVVILTGTQGDETHEARLRGYKAGAEEAGGEVIEVQYCDAQAEKAATAMEAIMQKFPDGVDVVLSSNDDMAMSAVKIIKDSGNAAYADTVICGFDGNQSAIEAVKDGTLTMDIAQLGYDMGYKAVEAAVKVLDGESVESYIDSGAKVVDAAGADEYITDMKDKGLWE